MGMNIFNNRLSKKINDSIRQRFILPEMRKKLLNHDITIISNNCTGGFVYHDLGLRFNSPTINLSFASDKDFFSFAENLPYYLSCEVREISSGGGVPCRCFRKC